MRRLVVFPLQVSEQNQVVADEAWWEAREELTNSRRFLVASKQFLLRADAFQPRGKLEPADAIILGRLLDAHALVTLQLEERTLTMNVYDGGNGLLLWQKSVKLHPSLTVRDQLLELTENLVRGFVASIPYQGFTIVDSLIGKAIYEEGDIKLVQVDLGVETGAQIGDVVQWTRLESTNAAPTFQGGAKMTAFAEGKIVRIEQGIATVELLRATSVSDIKEYSLVRVPREAERMRAEAATHDTPRTTLPVDLVSPEADPMKELKKERRPLVMALSVIASLAAFLLLAL